MRLVEQVCRMNATARTASPFIWYAQATRHTDREASIVAHTRPGCRSLSNARKVIKKPRSAFPDNWISDCQFCGGESYIWVSAHRSGGDDFVIHYDPTCHYFVRSGGVRKDAGVYPPGWAKDCDNCGPP